MVGFGDPLNRVYIRYARFSDLWMISSLSGKAFKRYGRYEKTIRRWFLSGNTVTFVALHSNKKGGFIMVGPIDIYQTAKNYPEVLAIAVKPQFQGMGIGRELLLKAEEELKDLGIRRLYLHTSVDNLRAQRLFQRMGYRVLGVKRVFYDRGQDAYLMSKDIIENSMEFIIR